MLLLLILFLQWQVATYTASPTFEDNTVPIDEELLSDLVNSYHYDPSEREIALHLPTDQNALNEIKPALQFTNPYYSGGRERYISSYFPEIDARGAHKSVFNDFNNFNTAFSQTKKYDSPLGVGDRSLPPDLLTDVYQFLHPVKQFYKYNDDIEVRLPSRYKSRTKRSSLSNYKFNKRVPFHIPPSNDKQQDHSCTNGNCTQTSIISNITLYDNLNYPKSSTKSNHNHTNLKLREKRSSPPWDVDNLQNKRKSQTMNRFYANMFDIRSPGFQNHLSLSKRESDETSPTDLQPNELDTIVRRVPEMDKSGFHNDVFHHNFGNFDTLMRALDTRYNGLYDNAFHQNFGHFDTLKRIPEMGPTGFHNDVFHKNFGDFETLRKRKPTLHSKNFNNDAFNRDFGDFDTLRKRKSGPTNFQRADISFDIDRDLGNFYTGKRRPNAGVVNADAFHSNFGIFETLKKRHPRDELNGDAFHDNFGKFDTMKRTLGGDAFHSEFGKFETMKRTPDMDRNNFDGARKRSTLLREETNNNEENFDKIRPQRFNEVPYFPTSEPQYGEDYEKFRQFFRNYALANNFDDMTKKIGLQFNETAIQTSSTKNNSSSIP